jgi:hypothetical protein
LNEKITEEADLGAGGGGVKISTCKLFFLPVEETETVAHIA